MHQSCEAVCRGFWPYSLPWKIPFQQRANERCLANRVLQSVSDYFNICHIETNLDEVITPGRARELLASPQNHLGIMVANQTDKTLQSFQEATPEV